MSAPAPKLAEIASRIYAHLNRMELAQKDRGSTSCNYWYANAWPAGSRVGIRYISYQFTWHLKKDAAWRYLQWLDSGKEGTHWKCDREIEP